MAEDKQRDVLAMFDEITQQNNSFVKHQQQARTSVPRPATGTPPGPPRRPLSVRGPGTAPPNRPPAAIPRPPGASAPIARSPQAQMPMRIPPGPPRQPITPAKPNPVPAAAGTAATCSVAGGSTEADGSFRGPQLAPCAPSISASPSRSPTKTNARENDIDAVQSDLATVDLTGQNTTEVQSSESQPRNEPPLEKPKEEKPAASEPKAEQPVQKDTSSSGWGWMFSAASQVASQAVEQAKNVAEGHPEISLNNLGHLNISESFRHAVGGELNYAKLNDLGQSTMKGLNGILNSVAPPMEEHELIEVRVDHSMRGYSGVVDVAYQSLSRAFSHIKGAQVTVEDVDKVDESDVDLENVRDNLQYIEGLDAAYHATLSTLKSLIARFKSDVEVELPSTLLLLHVQPALIRLNPDPRASPSLAFVVALHDIQNNVQCVTISQGLPDAWLDLPYSQNEWVEDFIVDALSQAFSVVASEYVRNRGSEKRRA